MVSLAIAYREWWLFVMFVCHAVAQVHNIQQIEFELVPAKRVELVQVTRCRMKFRKLLWKLFLKITFFA